MDLAAFGLQNADRCGVDVVEENALYAAEDDAYLETRGSLRGDVFWIAARERYADGREECVHLL